MEPAPITPSSGDEAAPFKLMAGTIKTVYRAHRNVTDDETVIVSPGIMSGNTGMFYCKSIANSDSDYFLCCV